MKQGFLPHTISTDWTPTRTRGRGHRRLCPHLRRAPVGFRECVSGDPRLRPSSIIRQQALRFGADRCPVELALDPKLHGDGRLKGAAPYRHGSDEGDLVAEIDNPLNVIGQELSGHVERAAFLESLFRSLAKVPYALLYHIVRGCFLQFSHDPRFSFSQSHDLRIQREVDSAIFVAFANVCSHSVRAKLWPNLWPENDRGFKARVPR